MTVNLTLNDITAKGATEVLKLIQTIETQPTANPESAKQESSKTTVEAVKNFALDVNELNSKVEKSTSDTESVKQPNETEFTIEEVRSAFAKFAKANGKDAAKEVLAKFNANKVTGLKESDYSNVMKVLEGEQ